MQRTKKTSKNITTLLTSEESSDEIHEQHWQSFCNQMKNSKYAREWLSKAGSFTVITFLMYLFSMYGPKTTTN
ncbi:hypothetical protein IPH67_00425 [bacterium]|nr:MAG: hypothetical protein IPH67_00425 [bacterium]